MAQQSFFRTMAEEKGILENEIQVTGDTGLINYMTVENVIESIEHAPAHEQIAIENTFRRIDFENGNLTHFITHLAQAIAV